MKKIVVSYTFPNRCFSDSLAFDDEKVKVFTSGTSKFYKDECFINNEDFLIIIGGVVLK